MKNLLTIKKVENCEHITGKGLVSLPAHTHKSYTIVFICEGSLSICLNENKFIAVKGTVIVLPPNNAIAMEPTLEYVYHSLSIHNKMCIKMCASVGYQPFILRLHA